MRLKRTSGLEDGKGEQEQRAQALGKRSQRRIVTQGNEGRRAEPRLDKRVLPRREVPSLLEGPELAPDVALLEGLSGEWEERDYRDVVNHVIGRQTLVREAHDWHPHQPYAERELERNLEILETDIDF